MQQQTTHVFLAGIGNSGPDHWQRHWHQRRGNGVWVEHASWDAPERDLWVKDLDDALASIRGPKVLVAHSLGCLLLTEWAREHQDSSITGALLVAVPDVDGTNFPADARGFSAPAHAPLPFPTVLVASEDDPYGTLDHSTVVAGGLGSRLVNVGLKGHINADSGLGDWREGQSLVQDHFAH